MATGNDCVDYARECVRFAVLTKDPRLRDQLLNMAREWMGAAMDDEAAEIKSRV
jgi:hypothetical protein